MRPLIIQMNSLKLALASLVHAAALCDGTQDLTKKTGLWATYIMLCGGCRIFMLAGACLERLA